MKSAFDAGSPPTRTPGPAAWAALRTASSVSLPACSPLSAIGIASTSALPPRRQSGAAGATAPWTPSTALSAGRGARGVGAALDQHLVWQQRALADPRPLERDQ